MMQERLVPPLALRRSFAQGGVSNTRSCSSRSFPVQVEAVAHRSRCARGVALLEVYDGDLAMSATTANRTRSAMPPVSFKDVRENPGAGCVPYSGLNKTGAGPIKKLTGGAEGERREVFS